MQRTSRARLPDQFSPWFVLIGYNLFCLLAVSGYFMGITQSKEYAEPEWYADIWLVIVWVTYLVLYLRTLARRKEPHIYVARSEEHTSELQSLMRISYAVFCLKKK